MSAKLNDFVFLILYNNVLKVSENDRMRSLYVMVFFLRYWAPLAAVPPPNAFLFSSLYFPCYFVLFLLFSALCEDALFCICFA